METREYRGILHCHSHYSYDAKLSLAQLRELFMSWGLSFVCMTEHTDELTKERAEAFVHDCVKYSDDRFLFVPGFEVPYKVNAKGREGALGHPTGGAHAHILMIGAHIFHGQYAKDFEALKPWLLEDIFVVLAHPVRNNFKVDDELISVLDGLEVWNQQYEGKQVPRTRSLRYFEELKEKRPMLVATGGVDFHRKEHNALPYITLSLPELNPRMIVEKLKVGAFTISASNVTLYGTLPDAHEVRQKYRFQSLVSVSVIVLGKTVNATLARFGIKLPKGLKELVRRKI